MVKIGPPCTYAILLNTPLMGACRKGKAFFDVVRKAGFEGMVATRRKSECAGALNDYWLKIKCLRIHDPATARWRLADVWPRFDISVGGARGTRTGAFGLNATARAVIASARARSYTTQRPK